MRHQARDIEMGVPRFTARSSVCILTIGAWRPAQPALSQVRCSFLKHLNKIPHSPVYILCQTSDWLACRQTGTFIWRLCSIIGWSGMRNGNAQRLDVRDVIDMLGPRHKTECPLKAECDVL